MYYLHTGTNKNVEVREDTGYRFYVDGQDRAYAPEQIERFKEDLRKECEKKSALIIQRLDEMELIERLNTDFMSDPRLAELVQDAFRSITQKT
jgi:hypothetical protein